jgi:hypothetical protein
MYLELGNTYPLFKQAISKYEKKEILIIEQVLREGKAHP